MRQTNVVVETYLAGAGAAEADVLKSTGAHRQKYFLRRRRHCCCDSPPAEHTDDAGVVGVELEPADADADVDVDADVDGRSDRVMWMWRAIWTLTNR